MEVIHADSTSNLPPNTVMALGNFDGVHLGHRAIIKKTVKKAQLMRQKSSVLLFEPHPYKVLEKKKKPYLLTTINDRCLMLGNIGIDIVFVEKFTKKFASLLAEEFLEIYLTKKFAISGVVVGFDYTFGHQGKGTTFELEHIAKESGFSVEIIEPVIVNNKIVSSSLARTKLLQGKVDEVSKILGYNYFIRGTVVSDRKIGRTLGFPTANLQLPSDIILPANGVYLVMATYKNRQYYGLSNLGFRPTVFGQTLAVEIHLLNFSENIYGEVLVVSFLEKLREERSFKDREKLKSQIRQDVLTAKKIIEGYGKFN